MSEFIGTLELEVIGDRKWRLLKTLLYSSEVGRCTITIPKGTVTDLLSTYSVPLFSNIFDGTNIAPGLLHDYLYQSKMFGRKKCDEILREACIATGTSRWKAWIIWMGVRLGGEFHYGVNK